jgi:hypothetical protein
MVRYKSWVSFEYDLEPVVTVRPEIAGTSWNVAASRAVKAAFKAHPNSKPRSLVIVLERCQDEIVSDLPEAVTEPSPEGA